MSKRFTIMAILCSVCLVASNLFETKIFSASPLSLTGGLLIFPIAYIVNDCITELYGFKWARFAVLTAFGVNAFFVLMAQLVVALPADAMWDGQEHFKFIFKADLRITIASMLAFICGSLLNALVMTKMKAVQGEKGFGWRAVLSSLAGESCDSLIFFPIAFWDFGFSNIVKLMITQIILKTLYEVVILPVTASVVKYFKANPEKISAEA